MVPEDVWIAKTTGIRGLKDADALQTLNDTWQTRLQEFEQYHKQSLQILKAAYPNLYARTYTSAKLDYATMKKRFSQDGQLTTTGTTKCVGVNLVQRMKDILINKLPPGLQSSVMEDGDLEASAQPPGQEIIVLDADSETPGGGGDGD